MWGGPGVLAEMDPPVELSLSPIATQVRCPFRDTFRRSYY
jgi:hypothetical protein